MRSYSVSARCPAVMVAKICPRPSARVTMVSPGLKVDVGLLGVADVDLKGGVDDRVGVGTEAAGPLHEPEEPLTGVRCPVDHPLGSAGRQDRAPREHPGLRRQRGGHAVAVPGPVPGGDRLVDHRGQVPDQVDRLGALAQAVVDEQVQLQALVVRLPVGGG